MFKNVMSFIGATALILKACELTMNYCGQATLTGALASVFVFIIGYSIYGYIALSASDSKNN